MNGRRESPSVPKHDACALRERIARLKGELKQAEEALASIETRCKHAWEDLPSTVRVVPGGTFTDVMGWRPVERYREEQRFTVYHRACKACGRKESTESWRSESVQKILPNWGR